MTTPTRSRTLTALLAGALIFGLVAPAAAQDQSSDEGVVGQVVNNALSSTTLGGLLAITTTVGPFITTSQVVNNATGGGQDTNQKPGQSNPERRRQRSNQVQLIIRGGGPALQQAVAVGGGEALDDMALMFAVPPRDHAAFAQLVREHRAQLLPLLDAEKVSAERTQAFMLTIERAMAVDAQLASHLHELLIWEFG